jgi:hypothetical protein
MKRILFIFLIAPFFLTAQDYSDTMYIAREAEQLYLYQYRTFEDGKQEGLISGAFRVPIDSAQAAQYVAAQLFQLSNDYWLSEVRRINSATFSRKVIELDSLSILQFGRSALQITRDAAKPDLLSYKVTAPDTAFYYDFVVRAGQTNTPVVITELSNGNIRLTPQTGTAANIQAVNVNVLRFTFAGTSLIFFRSPTNPNIWEAYGTGKSVTHRLIRTVSAKASAEFRAQKREE